MAMKFKCDDGFMVQGQEDEATEMAALHIVRTHPEMTINADDLKKQMEMVESSEDEDDEM